jgi:hypothetical protein
MTATAETGLITAPGVYPDVPLSVYLGDPVEGGSLSSSGARVLVEPGGPARFKYRLDHPGEENTDAFDFGRAAHQVILDDPEEHLVIVDAPDWKTKAAQQLRTEAREAGLTPILTKQWEQVQEMAAAIQAHPTAAALLQRDSGLPEQTIVWQDKATKAWCRSRVDWLRHSAQGQRLLIVDFKTTLAADGISFGKSAANYGYFLQAAFYTAGARAVGLDAEPAFVMVVQEKTAPYLVNVVQLDDTALHLGDMLMRSALERYAECRRTGHWPGFGPEVELVPLPSWFLRQYGEED